MKYQPKVKVAAKEKRCIEIHTAVQFSIKSVSSVERRKGF